MFIYREDGIVLYTSHRDYIELQGKLSILKISIVVDSDVNMDIGKRYLYDTIQNLPEIDLGLSYPNYVVVDNKPLIFMHISHYTDYMCSKQNNGCLGCLINKLCDICDDNMLFEDELIYIVS